jgi:septal ring factor EnvC (AmiA/AmiB activator)
MNDYNFEFKSLNDRICDLETEVERLKNENIETTNILYEIMNTLDKFNDSEYDLRKFTLGE